MDLRENLEEVGNNLKEAPVENLGTIGVVEIFTAPLWYDYQK